MERLNIIPDTDEEAFSQSQNRTEDTTQHAIKGIKS